MGTVDHENIVRYKEVQHTGNVIYIVLEYFSNGDFHKLIQKTKEEGRKFREPDILEWFEQLCEAIGYLHRNNILHRDIKPANILLSDENNVKVTDFGLSKIQEYTSAPANSSVGTPAYESPELINGSSYGKKADVWAIGCVLFELMHLKRAFCTPHMTRGALIANILAGRTQPEDNRYSPKLHATIIRLLQINERNRPYVNEIMPLHPVEEQTII